MTANATQPDSLDLRGVPADQFLGIEQHALNPIPLDDRHTPASGLFPLWAASQASFDSIFTGALLLGLGLGLIDAAIAVLIGGLLAAAVLGLLSVLGPRTGATQVVASRAVFGIDGARIGALFTLFLGVGWFAVDSVLATQALVALAQKASISDTKPLEAVLLLIVVLASMLVAVYGHQTISVFERFAAPVFVAFALLVFVILIPKMHFDTGSTLHGADHVGSWVLGISFVFALIASWWSFASDYSRYVPPAASTRRVAFSAGGGMALTTCLLGVMGVCLLTLTPAHDPNNLQGAISDALPSAVAVPFLLYVALGEIWSNYFDVYTAGLSALAGGLRLSRWGAAAFCGVLGGIIAYVALFYSDFATQYTNFLALTYLWAPGWAAVVLADFFIRRHTPSAAELAGRSYRFGGGFAWNAIASWAIGTAAAIPFVNSSLWTSPLSQHALHGADISGAVAFVVAGAVYLGLRGSGTEKALR
jgi:nucleobase:cation symporter-1, NCS1 family